MIDVLKVPSQQNQELQRRGLRQDDKALLPREFLGRWCFFIYVVNTGAIPYSLAVFPPYHVHVRQEPAIINAAEVPGGSLACSGCSGGRRCCWSYWSYWSAGPRPVFIFFGDYYFCHPGVWASVKPSNLKPRRIHP